jgi:hypothetical protein
MATGAGVHRRRIQRQPPTIVTFPARYSSVLYVAGRFRQIQADLQKYATENPARSRGDAS